jgi:DNA-binding NtrC family response regulator
VVGRVLIIDDEPSVGSLLMRTLASADLEVESYVDPEQGLTRLRERAFDFVVTDLRMPEIDGLEVLRRAKAIRPSCEVILITAHATVATAREALKRGALDYVCKPFSVEDELLPILLDGMRAGPADGESGAEPRAHLAFQEGTVVGRSPLFLTALQRAEKIAKTRSPVLLLGESGCGKEVFANLVHQLSPRAERPMIRVNCAALPESLLESELFGHTRGAFTGATRDQMGLFEAANGGTLFLDEIGEISPAVQPKLLRVLQDGELQRIGEPGRSQRVDVRVVAATNRDLLEAVRRGAFRQDLYYRLAVVPLELPALRERVDDLPDLIAHFAYRLGARVEFDEEAMSAMEAYPWPGNLRELANAVEHAVVLGDPPRLHLGDLPAALQEHARHASHEAPSSETDTLDEIEQRCILQALERTHFNRSRAARLLGITRRTLGYRIQKYGLDERIEAARGLPERPGPRSVRPGPPAGCAQVGAETG